jgi:hypothetical protein
MKRTLVALYKSYSEAERALGALFDAGFDRNSVSIMSTPNPEGKVIPESDSERVNRGAGAAVGGIAGAALGLTALTIPGVGPLVAAGPLAAALGATGAAAGAGGLTGLLIGLGITNDEAKSYASRVNSGGAIVVIETDDARAPEAEHILRKSAPVRVDQTTGAADVTARPARPDHEPMELENASNEPHNTDYGPTQFAPENPHYSSSFDEFAGVFQRSKSVFFGTRGEDYEPYREAYDFGYRAAVDRKYASKSWVEALPDLRREWEERKRDWAAFNQAVYQGWEAARGAG